jgi:C4-dicarboxylate-specific signal transduction histidine kinase
LSVISGRAQLLADSESDEDKKQMLAQIRDRTGEISQIITDLLAFARPTEPAKRSVLAEELLAKAIEATCRQCGLGSMEIEIAGEAKQAAVYVDVHQVTQSLSFVLTNALQSYKGGNGPVWIDCAESLDEHAVSAAWMPKHWPMHVSRSSHRTRPDANAAWGWPTPSDCYCLTAGI